MREYQQYIGGQWTSSGEMFDDLDRTGVRSWPAFRLGPGQTRPGRSTRQPRPSPAGPTCPRPGSRPCSCAPPTSWNAGRTEITALLATETGCAAAFADFQVLTATRLLRQAANWGYLPAGEVIRSDMPGTFALALRRPLGVVAGISRGTEHTCWPGDGGQPAGFRQHRGPQAFGRGARVGRAPGRGDHGRGRVPARSDQRDHACTRRSHTGCRRVLRAGPKSGASTSPARQPPGESSPSGRGGRSSGACSSSAGTTR